MAYSTNQRCIFDHVQTYLDRIVEITYQEEYDRQPQIGWGLDEKTIRKEARKKRAAVAKKLYDFLATKL